MGKLTKRSVDSMAIPASGQTFLWDDELRGFGVRAMPSGLKVFVLQYRNDEGRSRRIVLGRYGVLTVEQARKQAIMKLGAVAGGALVSLGICALWMRLFPTLRNVDTLSADTSPR